VIGRRGHPGENGALANPVSQDRSVKVTIHAAKTTLSQLIERAHAAEHAGQLRIAHRDPVDRMLIAQAQTEDMWLVSNENAFDSMGVRRYW